MKKQTTSCALVLMIVVLAGCSAAQIERNMNCFAGTISGPLNKFSNSLQRTISKVRSCSRLKKSKESGGISSYVHKDYVFVSSIDPAALAPGESMRSNICYEVKTEAGRVQVTELRTLITPSGEKIPLAEEVFQRENGYWESFIDVQIPNDIEQGDYLLSNQVIYDDVKLEGQYKFTVWDRQALKSQCGSDKSKNEQELP